MTPINPITLEEAQTLLGTFKKAFPTYQAFLTLNLPKTLLTPSILDPEKQKAYLEQVAYIRDRAIHLSQFPGLPPRIRGDVSQCEFLCLEAIKNKVPVQIYLDALNYLEEREAPSKTKTTEQTPKTAEHSP